MKRTILLLFLIVGPMYAQQATVPEIRYRSVPDFLKLPPDLYFGEVPGIAVNSQGAHLRFLAQQHHGNRRENC